MEGLGSLAQGSVRDVDKGGAIVVVREPMRIGGVCVCFK